MNSRCGAMVDTIVSQTIRCKSMRVRVPSPKYSLVPDPCVPFKRETLFDKEGQVETNVNVVETS